MSKPIPFKRKTLLIFQACLMGLLVVGGASVVSLATAIGVIWVITALGGVVVVSIVGLLIAVAFVSVAYYNWLVERESINV